MRWLSIDPADRAGFACWEGDHLINAVTLRPALRGEKKRGTMMLGASPMRSFYAAIYMAIVIGEHKAVFIEESMGKSPKTVSQLGEFRGYVRAICDHAGVTYKAVNTSEWRSVVAGLYGLTFPRNTDDAKALSIKLAKDFCGLDLTGDEADAVNVGRWALRTGAVTP